MKVEPAAQKLRSFPGTVEARFSTDLAFRTLGRLITRNVDVGNAVTQGEVIGTLDPTSQELAVRSAEADLRNNEAQRRNAEITQSRLATLDQSGLGTKTALEQAQQALLSATANVNRARANLSRAEEQLGYTRLKAQFDGIVISIHAEIGQTLDPGARFVTLVKPDVREAVIDMPEPALAYVRVGTSFVIDLQLDPSVTARGSVREMSPAADAATRTRRVKIALDRPSVAFRIGSIINATMTSIEETTIVVPASAVLEGTPPQVWVVDEAKGVVLARQIVADSNSLRTDRVVVLSGLEVGERIVTAGVHHLSNGQPVRFERSSSL
jgi:RND family efflux transporter MFP subunit